MLNEAVSAANVLVTTRWIFLEPHAIGLIWHVWFCAMLSCAATIMSPAYESGTLGDENDASENARNLTL